MTVGLVRPRPPLPPTSPTILISPITLELLFNPQGQFNPSDQTTVPNLQLVQSTMILVQNQSLLTKKTQWMSIGSSRVEQLTSRSKDNAEVAGPSAPLELFNLTFLSRASEEWICQNSNWLIAKKQDLKAVTVDSKIMDSTLQLRTDSWLNKSTHIKGTNKSAPTLRVHTKFQDTLMWLVGQKWRKP